MKSSSWKNEVARGIYLLQLLRRLHLLLRLALEHLEHAGGAEEAADDVDRAERDRDDEQQLREPALDAEAEDDDAAEHDDPVHRVRAAHQRRVQRVRDLRDHEVAGERGQHEHRHVLDEDRDGDGHQAAAPSTVFLAPSWTISPSRVTHAPAMISSSKFRLRLPSSSSISSSSDWTLRA